MDANNRLAQLGITLPEARTAAANYVTAISDSGILYLSGQIGFKGQEPIVGTLGNDCTIEEGVEAARQAALQLLAQIARSLNSLERVTRVLRLNVFIASAPHFREQPLVANGASDLFVAVFGDRGQHTRSAIGVASLPLGAAVEIDAVIAYDTIASALGSKAEG